MSYQGLGYSAYSGMGHVGPVTMGVTTKTHNGYSYRVADMREVAKLVEEWKTVGGWTYMGQPAVAPRFAVKTPGFSYNKTDDVGNVLKTIVLPSNTYLITPNQNGGAPFLEWFAAQEGTGKGLIGLPSKGRVPVETPPYTPGGDVTLKFQHYEEKSILSPPREDADWIFVITDDIKLVSDLCDANTHAAVLFEPTTGWVTPEEKTKQLLLYGGIGLAVVAGVGYLLFRKPKYKTNKRHYTSWDKQHRHHFDLNARKSPKIKATSFERYRASASQRRLHGGKTVTIFYVSQLGYPTLEVTGYGPTPGQRKTYAIEKAKKIWAKG